MSRESNNWRNQAANSYFWHCHNTAFESKCDFCVSSFCHVEQKHKVFEVAKSDFWLHTLSVTFLPKISNPFKSVKVIANQTWNVFWDTVYIGIYDIMYLQVWAYMSILIIFLCRKCTKTRGPIEIAGFRPARAKPQQNESVTLGDIFRRGGTRQCHCRVLKKLLSEKLIHLYS